MPDVPPAVLAAIAKVSERVLCLEDCFSTVSVGYSLTRDCLVIKHPDPECHCVRNPGGESAVTLADFVVSELSRYVVMADYGELAVNIA